MPCWPPPPPADDAAARSETQQVEGMAVVLGVRRVESG